VLAQTPPFRPLVERIGARGFCRSSRQLIQACRETEAGRLTCIQARSSSTISTTRCAYGLTAKRSGSPGRAPERLRRHERKPIVEDARLFFGSGGNPNETTGEKFLPGFVRGFLRGSRAGAGEGSRAGPRRSSPARWNRRGGRVRCRVSSADQHQEPAAARTSHRSSNNYYQAVQARTSSRVAEKEHAEFAAGEENGKRSRRSYTGRHAGRQGPARALSRPAGAVRTASCTAAPRFADPGLAGCCAPGALYRTAIFTDWNDFNILGSTNDEDVDFAPAHRGLPRRAGGKVSGRGWWRWSTSSSRR